LPGETRERSTLRVPVSGAKHRAATIETMVPPSFYWIIND
jgi:hypothetical protein